MRIIDWEGIKRRRFWRQYRQNRIDPKTGLTFQEWVIQCTLAGFDEL